MAYVFDGMARRIRCILACLSQHTSAIASLITRIAPKIALLYRASQRGR